MLQAAQAAVRLSHHNSISALQILQRRLSLLAGQQQEHHQPLSQQHWQNAPASLKLSDSLRGTILTTFRSSSSSADGQVEAAAAQAPVALGNAGREAETPLLHAIRNRIMVRRS